MSDKAFLDTNILLYTIGQDDVRTPVAEALVQQGGIVSVQVLNELASVAHRKLKMSWQDITRALGALRILCPSVVPMTAGTHEAALVLAFAVVSYSACYGWLQLAQSVWDLDRGAGRPAMREPAGIVRKPRVSRMVDAAGVGLEWLPVPAPENGVAKSQHVGPRHRRVRRSSQ